MTGNAGEMLRREMEGWASDRLYDVLATSPQQYRQWAAAAELTRRRDLDEADLRQAQHAALEWQRSHSQRIADATAKQANAVTSSAEAAERNSGETARIAQRTLKVLMLTLVATGLAAIGQIASVVVTLVEGKH